MQYAIYYDEERGHQYVCERVISVAWCVHCFNTTIMMIIQKCMMVMMNTNMRIFWRVWSEFIMMIRKRLLGVCEWLALPGVYCFKIQSFNWTCSSSHPLHMCVLCTIIDCIHCSALCYTLILLSSCFNKDPL